MNNKLPTIKELEKILSEPSGPMEIAPDGTVISSAFRNELESILNRHSKENGSSTPDFILADFLIGSLSAFDRATVGRARWYGKEAGFGFEKKLPDENQELES